MFYCILFCYLDACLFSKRKERGGRVWKSWGREDQNLNAFHKKNLYKYVISNSLIFRSPYVNVSICKFHVSNINFHLYSGASLLSHNYTTENCHSLELFSFFGTQDAPLHTRHISKRNGPTYRNVFPGCCLSYKCFYSSPF